MTFIRSSFVPHSETDPVIPPHKEPPDKHLRALHRVKIRTLEMHRQRSPISKDKKKLDWDCEELNWFKDANGNWIPPDHFDTQLDTDPLVSYEHTARIDDIVMNITTAPVEDLHSTAATSETVKLHLEQSDTGANANITPHLQLLHDVRWFNPVTIGNAQKDSTLQVSAIGKFPLRTSEGIRDINMYYSPNATNTIVTPTAICKQSDNLIGFHQWSNVESNEGVLSFVDADNNTNFLISMTGDNGLWYHSATPNPVTVKSIQVNAMSDAALWELWHQRLGHCGRWAMENAHKHVDGIPKLRGNSFYKCPSCMAGKLCTKRSNSKTSRQLGSVVTAQPDARKGTLPDLRDTTVTTDDHHIEELLDDLHLPDAKPGQHFHIDFGFVRGSDYSTKDSDTGKTFTSIDNKNSYLLIVDRKTRYMWIHTSASKEPPLEAVRAVLTKFGSNDKHRTVRSDQDKGLGKSKAFLTMLEELHFTPELTGTDNSQQNSRTERPHRDLGQMMRCLLHSSTLGPEYWTHSIALAVFVKNRIPHKSIGKTPFEAFTGKRPNLEKLRIFGSRIRAKKPGNRKAKLDHHTESGIFIGYSATSDNVYFIDDATGLVKLGTHVIFDEAHMSVPARKAPLSAEALQRVGYYNREQWIDDCVRNEFQADSTQRIQVERITPTALLPTRGTKDAIGMDLYSDMDDVTIQPDQTLIFQTGIRAAAPPGTYLRVAPRSGLTVNKHLNTLAGVIDPDYRGNIGVVLHNFGKIPRLIKRKDRIAQLIVERAQQPIIVETKNLTSTQRADNGFGSTDKKHTPTPAHVPILPRIHPHPTTAAAALVNFANTSTDLNLTLDMPYDIELSDNPFDTYTDRYLTLNGDHPTLGIELEDNPLYGLPQLKHCARSTPSARWKRWRSELRNGFIRKINDTPVTCAKDVAQIIAECRTKKKKELCIHFALIDTIPIHTEKGLPQLFYDQLNTVSKHLFELRHDPAYNERFATILGLDDMSDSHMSEENRKILEDLHGLIAHKVDSLELTKSRAKLSRRKLKECTDWDDWQQSEFKQLDQYHAQDTFGEPTTLPRGANVLNLLWTYLIKDDGRKKARCVCNGSKNMRGSVTLAETYAAALEQTGSRIFWAATALNNFICIGADAANAFAEAPAPIAPLYVRVDDPFREWYHQKFPDRPKLEKYQVMKVLKALQGHPESARLWALLIDQIIRELNLKPCTHEPNLYYTTNYNGTGKTVLFLRQVDDFAISCQDKETATHVINNINSKMTIDVKELGMIDRFNGVDILQTRNFIKLSNATYFRKIFQHHHWMRDEYPLSKTKPVPMRDNPNFQRDLENAEPLTPEELAATEKKLGFTYRQAIGEMIYGLVTCRPDISFAITKLSQYSARPALIHFEAIKQVYKYIEATIDRGIIFWRKSPNMSLPFHQDPTPDIDANYDQSASAERIQNQPTNLFGAVDSDCAGDNTHRKSVSGIIIKIAGGTVLYKTQYQPTIALSTTEAEFTAASEAGKYILYVRSILHEIGLTQDNATVLFEDNQGALLMANAQRPTKRTRHMDVKHFVIQQWIAQDLLTMKRISTNDNFSDVMTKATGKTLFYRHFDYIQGYVKPDYAP